MKRILLICSLFTMVLGTAMAQEPTFHELDQGAGYVNAVFWNIADDTKTTISHTDWDIAFGVGGFSSAVFINDGVGGTQQDPQAEVILYMSTEDDFNAANSSHVGDRVYNREDSWDEGAFNHVGDPADFLDLGWGTYNTSNQNVDGSRVYFVRDRAEVLRKVKIESLISGVYTMRYANADGSDEQTVMIDKDDYEGKTMAYFSFANGAQDLEPDEWDLIFTRYQTPLEFGGPGNFIDYTLTGALHNKNRVVAELSDVDVETVPAPVDEEAYESNLDVIGWDWKDFNGSTFDIVSDLVYFLKNTETDQVFRISFIDFDRDLGISTVRIVDEGIVSNVYQNSVYANAVKVFPNPAAGQTSLEIEASQNAMLQQVELVNAVGQTVRVLNTNRPLSVGFNQVPVDLTGVAAGQYFVRMTMDNGVAVEPLTVR